MTFRHDDQIGIPQNAVTVQDNKMAHVALGWMFAVTRDSGRTWSVWNASKDLPGWFCCNYGLIKNLELAPDGRGTMTLNPIDGRAGEVPKLYTSDYGRSWSPNGG